MFIVQKNGTIYNIAHRVTYKDGLHYKSDVSTIPKGSKDSIDTNSETDILDENQVRDSQCL